VLYGDFILFTETINNIQLTFETADTVFSPNGLDAGTLAMLSAVDLTPDEKLLDLGCGYGAVGIYSAKLIGEKNVVMSDVDDVCVELSMRNSALNGLNDMKIIQSDGFDNIEDNDFTLILSNPPYHTDFSVPKRIIEKGFNRLKIGGKMYMVTKRKDWYMKKLTAIFGGVRIMEINEYYIFSAEKRSTQYANTSISKKGRN